MKFNLLSCYDIIYHSKGTFALPLYTLRDPLEYLRVRDVKEWYVDYLITLIGEEDAEDLTAPFLVVASVAASVFVASKISSYTYEVYKSNVDKMSTAAI